MRNTTYKCASPDTVISNTITITFTFVDIPVIASNSSRYSLNPNPNTGSFILQGVSAIGRPVRVTAMDITGRVIYNSTIQPENGNINSAITLSDHISPGIYILQLSSAGETHTLRFTVNK